MGLARHGDGPGPALRALGSQVHPVFALPPIAASWFGSVLAGRFAIPIGALHMTAILLAIYVAHVEDGYVDFYGRGEDDDHPLTERGCRLAIAGASVGFFLCLGGLWLVAGVAAVLVTLPGWFIGYFHAPQLDTNPVTTTTGYPLGVALAILGGYATQTGHLARPPVAFAVVFLLVLSGVKVVDDSTDVAYDRSIDKRTVAVVLGRARARRVAFGLMAAGVAAVVLLVVASVFPIGTLLAAGAFVAVAATTRRAGPERSTMLLIRGTYVFLAILFAAVWFRPFG